MLSPVAFKLGWLVFLSLSEGGYSDCILLVIYFASFYTCIYVDT